MNHHVQKCDPIPFQALLDGIKPFEIRLNDRHYQNGDTVTSQEFDRAKGKYSCRQLEYKIGFITNFSQKEGMVVYGCIDVKRIPDNPYLGI